MINQINKLKTKTNRVILPLDDKYASIGDLLVKISDEVKKGQQLTKVIPGNEYSVALHAPIDGTVTEIKYSDALQCKFIEITRQEINADNNDTEDTEKYINNDCHISDLNIAKLSDLLAHYGIVGLGGAGFPTNKKLNSSSINTLVINGVECEEPIAVDNCLMVNYSEKIIHGLEILNAILNPKEIIIAIKSTMTDAIKSIQQACNKHLKNNIPNNIQIKLINTPYPSGYSKTLIKNITGENIAVNSHSNQNGTICLNVATVYSLEQAVNYHAPLISRLVSITKSNSNQSESYNNKFTQNYLLPIGTTLDTILLEYGININSPKFEPEKLTIRLGGNYMGYEIPTNTPLDIENLRYYSIGKTTQAISIEYNKQASSLTDTRECIKCGFCEPVCPINLMPQQLYWFSKNLEHDNNTAILSQHDITRCIECGLCDSVCPSKIPLSAKFKYTKSKIKFNQHKTDFSEESKMRFQKREQRILLKKQEKFNKANKMIKSDKQSKKDLLASILKRAKNKNPDLKPNN